MSARCTSPVEGQESGAAPHDSQRRELANVDANDDAQAGTPNAVVAHVREASIVPVRWPG